MRYTTIIHEVRVELGITMMDYCVADCIYHYANNPKNPVPGWCFASKQHIADELGFTKSWVVKTIDFLEQKGLVERSDNGRLVKTTERWYKLAIFSEKRVGVQNTPVVPIGTDVVPIGTEIGVQNTPRTYNKSYIKSIGIEERKQKLIELIEPFKPKYEAKMLNEFYAYWTELNIEKTEMRFESEDYFEVGKRLSTWKKREPKNKGFAKPGDGPVEKASAPSVLSNLDRFNKEPE